MEGVTGSIPVSRTQNTPTLNEGGGIFMPSTLRPNEAPARALMRGSGLLITTSTRNLEPVIVHPDTLQLEKALLHTITTHTLMEHRDKEQADCKEQHKYHRRRK